MRIANSSSEVGVYFRMANVAFDAEGVYRLRARVKVEKASPNAKGEAFWMKLGEKEVRVNVEDVAADGYQWYDLYEGKLSRDWVFRIGCGNFARGGGVKAVKDLRFDRLEFMRCE